MQQTAEIIQTSWASDNLVMNARLPPEAVLARIHRTGGRGIRDLEERRETVGAAAAELNELREGWLNPPGSSAAELRKRTLTNLYNQRPTWLENIHARLDAAVADAYGWPADLADAEILERLLALNLERAGASVEQ